MPVTENRPPEDPKRVCSDETSDADSFTFVTHKGPPAGDRAPRLESDPIYTLERVDSGGDPPGAGAQEASRIDSETLDSHHRPVNQPFGLEISRTPSLLPQHKVDSFQRASASLPSHIPKGTNKYLRPNAVFVGDQESDKRCHVRVEFKTVDLVNSVLTGFLQISGLTPEHSEISTCFRGEIINNPLSCYKWLNKRNSPTETPIQRYSFITENKQWGSYPKNDLEHWRILSSASYYDHDSPEEHYIEQEEANLKQRLRNIQNGLEDNQFIYMRWKEEFLLPDSRVKQIEGASFEGFYFAVLNIGGFESQGQGHSNRIAPGSINGLYYHKTSSQLQSLNLRYVGEDLVSDSFEFL
ncbi:uncharacterized protein CANTADRAFT_26281 [Suhomyces tanzawaensis NRRL Y-17324]|uniref:Uncharacterized protein n=1 Tax=Suhomyces tanzawaensis NRRL Y-17324 TaxID=984487 RepID=A0A1E4SIJ5_9ASCO|nr:uncharacterized protein CANTADRAFT_26281 [Suhomyces tanzawaensis NRRL Y-17324]ODV79319.1 hypothetical protein CANTADRAFT_26281 [Suhomyces tanzawaensis NRRL Y-17324]